MAFKSNAADVLIIGAGAAGLAAGREKERGSSHFVTLTRIGRRLLKRTN